MKSKGENICKNDACKKPLGNIKFYFQKQGPYCSMKCIKECGGLKYEETAA